MSSGQSLGPCLPGNKVAIVPAVGAVFFAIGTTLLILRLYVRGRVVSGGYGWDDSTIILAWAFCVSAWGLSLAQVPYGFGRHAGCLEPENVVKELRLQYIAEVPLILSTLFSRMSICIFLLRIFSVNRLWRWSLYTIAGLTTVTNISAAIIILIQCEPRAKLWNPLIKGHCWAPHVQVDIGYYQGAMSSFLDICLSLLPIYFMWKVQLKWSLKIGICSLMSLGILTAACVTARTIYLGEIKGPDVTWDAVNVIVWANLEAQIAIIVANIPPSRPLFLMLTRRNQETRKNKETTRGPANVPRKCLVTNVTKHRPYQIAICSRTCRGCPEESLFQRSQCTVRPSAFLVDDGNDIFNIFRTIGLRGNLGDTQYENDFHGGYAVEHRCNRRYQRRSVAQLI